MIRKNQGCRLDEKIKKKRQKQRTKQTNNKGDRVASPLFQHDVFLSSEENKDGHGTRNAIRGPTKIIPSMPLSILSSNIMIGTGGNAVDSIVLHTKILEMFLSLSKSYNGMNSTHRIRGKVGSSVLARKIADSLQVPTQNVAANSGRILSVSCTFL